MQQAPSQYQPAQQVPSYPQQPTNYGQPPVSYNSPYGDYIPDAGYGEAPPAYRPPGIPPAPRENKNGIPTRKDGRVDTTFRQRMAAKARARGLLKAATNAPLPSRPPSVAGPQHAVTPEYYIPSVAPTQRHSLDQQIDISPDVATDDVDDAELSTLALIAVGTGVISVICGVTLMLFLWQKRQKVQNDPEGFKKYVRDHTPVSRHTSLASDQERRQAVSRPKDFMDQKDVEMVRTLSRAPMAAPDEYYLKSSKSCESKDSGFNSVKREASYVTSLKS